MVGLELLRSARLSDKKVKLKFWRDPSGPEVDWVIEYQGKYIPIELKWTESPDAKDAKHIKQFLKEYKNANQGYIICRTPREIKLDNQISAIPWQKTPYII